MARSRILGVVGQRRIPWQGQWGWVALLGLCLACAGPGAAPEATTAQASAVFSGAAAYEYLQALAAAPRVAGTEGAENARGKIIAVLKGLGLSPEPLEFHLDAVPKDLGEEADKVPDGTHPGVQPAAKAAGAEAKPSVALTSVLARIPGASSDTLLLATPFDSAPVAGVPGANEGASGAAVLLELARVLTSEPQPYTVVLAFLDGELLRDDMPWLGSRALVRHLAKSGALAQVRVLVYLHQVGDRDLRISRDLRSNRVFREKIFRAAARQGYGNVFDPDQLFDDVPGGQRVFEEAGFRRFVALVDPRYGGPDVPGPLWRTPQDDAAHCAPDSLEAVGRSVHGGLKDIAALLEKVDRFASPPEPVQPQPQVPSPDAAGTAPSPGKTTPAPEQTQPLAPSTAPENPSPGASQPAP